MKSAETLASLFQNRRYTQQLYQSVRYAWNDLIQLKLESSVYSRFQPVSAFVSTRISP